MISVAGTTFQIKAQKIIWFKKNLVITIFITGQIVMYWLFALLILIIIMITYYYFMLFSYFMLFMKLKAFGFMSLSFIMHCDQQHANKPFIHT